MNKYLYLVLLVSAIFVVGACNISKLRNNDAGLQQKWMLLSVDGLLDDSVTASKAYVLFGSGDSHNVGSAYAGCNRMSFAYEIAQKNRLVIKNISSTKMYCAENMELEMKLSDRLAEAAFYEIHEKVLLIKNTEEKVIVRAFLEK